MFRFELFEYEKRHNVGKDQNWSLVSKVENFDLKYKGFHNVNEMTKFSQVQMVSHDPMMVRMR